MFKLFITGFSRPSRSRSPRRPQPITETNAPKPALKIIPRALKRCRVCNRSSQEKDPNDENIFILWDASYGPPDVVEGLEVMKTKIDFYCFKVQELEFRKTPIGTLAKQYKDPDSSDFRDEWEVSRDAIISMAADLGPDQIRKKSFEKFKERVVRDTITATERSREATEYTKAVFEEMFKDDPEVLKKAVHYKVRVQQKNGMYKYEERVKIYDAREGVYRMKELERDEIRRRKVLEDREFARGGQAQSLAEDAAASAGIGIMATSNALSLADLKETRPMSRPSTRDPSTPRQSSKARTKVLQPQNSNESSQDDGVTPLESLLGCSSSRPGDKGGEKPQRGQKRAATSPSSSTAGLSLQQRMELRAKDSALTGAGLSSKAKADSDLLLKEFDAAMERFKLTESIEDLPLEHFVRTQTSMYAKARALGNKSGNAEGVKTLDASKKASKKLSAMNELAKAIPTMKKSKNKPNCTRVVEKFQEATESGVPVDGMAPCFRAAVIEAQVGVALADAGKHEEATVIMDESSWRSKPQDLTRKERLAVQTMVASEILLDCIRALSEKFLKSPSSEADSARSSAVGKLAGCLSSFVAFQPDGPLHGWLGNGTTFCRLKSATLQEIQHAWTEMHVAESVFLPFKSLQNLAPFEQVWQEGLSMIEAAKFAEQSVAKLGEKDEAVTEFVELLRDVTIEEGCLQNAAAFITQSLQLADKCSAASPEVADYLVRFERTIMFCIANSISMCVVSLLQWGRVVGTGFSVIICSQRCLQGLL